MSQPTCMGRGWVGRGWVGPGGRAVRRGTGACARAEAGGRAQTLPNPPRARPPLSPRSGPLAGRRRAARARRAHRARAAAAAGAHRSAGRRGHRGGRFGGWGAVGGRLEGGWGAVGGPNNCRPAVFRGQVCLPAVIGAGWNGPGSLNNGWQPFCQPRLDGATCAPTANPPPCLTPHPPSLQTPPDNPPQ